MSLRDLEASDKQYALMDKLGIEYDPQGVSVAEASALIDAKLGKKPKDISSNYSQDKTERASEKSSIGLRPGAPDKDTQMTKAEWNAKDLKYHKTQVLIAANGDLEKAKELLKWVYE